MAAPGLRWRGELRGKKIGYLVGMLGVIQLARVVTGLVLMIVGLVAIPLPVFPGIPIVLLGATIGFGWHPKGLRVLRRCKVKWGRVFRKRGPVAPRIG